MRYTVFFRRYAVFFRAFSSGLLSFVLHWVRGLFESFKDYQHCERCTEINLEISKRYSAFFSAFSTRYSSFVLQWPPLFFKLPKDWQHSKRRTNIKFDVSESFSGATLCFSLLFQNFFSPWFLHILHFLWSPIIETIYWTTHRHQIMDIKCLKIHTLQLAINDYQATEMGSLKKHKESVHMGVR